MKIMVSDDGFRVKISWNFVKSHLQFKSNKLKYLRLRLCLKWHQKRMKTAWILGSHGKMDNYSSALLSAGSAVRICPESPIINPWLWYIKVRGCFLWFGRIVLRFIVLFPVHQLLIGVGQCFHTFLTAVIERSQVDHRGGQTLVA